MSATASAPSMLTATGRPTWSPTRLASARTAADLPPVREPGGDVEQASARRSSVCQRWPMPGSRRPASRSAWNAPSAQSSRSPSAGTAPRMRMARLTTAPCSSPNDRMPAREGAHRGRPRGRDGARHEGGWSQRAVVDRRHQAGPQQVGLGRLRRVARHRRSSIAGTDIRPMASSRATPRTNTRSRWWR